MRRCRAALGCGVRALVILGAGCTVSFEAGPGPATDGAVPGEDADASSQTALDASLLDGGTEADALPEPPDGCVPLTDQELCTLVEVVCGTAAAFDNCFTWREVAECGPCSSADHCVEGVCIAYTYAWVTGGWSVCSAACGGGTQTRDVHCQREDGVTVADSYCTGPQPASSRSCNTQACCTPWCPPHDACGGDGCGGGCGTCGTDRFCYGNYCVWDHGNDGTQTCNTICAWGTSTCVGTSSHTCGTSGVGGIDCYCW